MKGREAGLLFLLGVHSQQNFRCLKSSFIFSLSTSESQVSLQIRMLGHHSFSFSLFPTFTLASRSRQVSFRRY